MESKSLGEQRIRTQFNPSSDNNVDLLKQKFAELIDLVNNSEKKDGEHGRLGSIAMTKIEEAAMWSVKTVTYNL